MSSKISVKLNERVLRMFDVVDRVGLSRSQIHNLMRTGDFPHSFRLSARAVGWLEDDIDEWIRKRAMRVGHLRDVATA